MAMDSTLGEAYYHQETADEMLGKADHRESSQTLPGLLRVKQVNWQRRTCTCMLLGHEELRIGDVQGNKSSSSNRSLSVFPLCLSRSLTALVGESLTSATRGVGRGLRCSAGTFYLLPRLRCRCLVCAGSNGDRQADTEAFKQSRNQFRNWFIHTRKQSDGHESRAAEQPELLLCRANAECMTSRTWCVGRRHSPFHSLTTV